MPDELAIDSGALIFATLADVYLSSGMTDEAISILKDGLSRNPTYTLAKLILGRAYYIKGDADEAIKVLEDALKEARDDENTNFYLGQCYEKLNDYDKAIEFYEATLKINPKNEEAKKRLDALSPEKVQPEHERVEPVAEETVPAEKEVAPSPEPVTPGAEGRAESMEEEESEVAPEPVTEIREEIEEAFAPTGQAVEEWAESIEEEKTEIVSEAAEGVKEDAEVVALPDESRTGAVGEVHEPATAEIQPPESLRISEQLPVAEIPFVPLESLNKPMNRLLSIDTVKGAFISSKEGLLIQSYFTEDIELEEMCAMIAEIHNEAGQSFQYLKQGFIEKFLIEKTNETICVISAGESLLTIITKKEAKPGLIFIYARNIIDEIKEILG